MLNDLFLRFYILSLPGVFSVCVFCLICFLMIWKHFGARWWWRPLLGGILLLWAAIVIYATVLSRPDGVESSLAAIPFHSYREVLGGGNPEILRSNLMNVVLFLPAGLLFTAILSRHWSRKRTLLAAAAVFALFSLGIEIAQYARMLGHAEMDDILHNTLGAVTGCLLLPAPNQSTPW